MLEVSNVSNNSPGSSLNFLFGCLHGDFKVEFDVNSFRFSESANDKLSDIRENIEEYKQALRKIARAKTSASALQRVKNTILVAYDLNLKANRMLREFDESISSKLKEASSKITNIIDSNSSRLPSYCTHLVLDAFSTFDTSTRDYVEHTQFFMNNSKAWRKQFNVNGEVSEKRSFEKLLDEFEENNSVFKKQLKSLLDNGFEAATRDEMVLVSSLAFQIFLFITVEIYDGKFDVPEEEVLDYIIHGLVRESSFLSSLFNELWSEQYKRYFVDELKEKVDNIRGIYADCSLESANSFFVDVSTFIEKKDVFKIYELEEELSERTPHLPDVEICFEPDVIPYKFQSFPIYIGEQQ